MHPSPLRSISNQQPAASAFQDLVKEATVMRQDLNQKDYELYEQDKLQRQHFSENQTIVHQIQTLEGDKVQWIKKMNALLVEKDRIMQEKTDIAADLHETRLRCDELERKLQHIGRKQATEKVVASDLKAEREENLRLRDIIHSLETERADLRTKVRENEMAAAGLTRDRSDLTGKLQQRMDHVALLDNDNRALQEQIRTLKIQISDFDLERAAHAHERGSLRETISRLEADKAEALVRISELSARHENYIQAIGNEKTSIEWMHRRHIRTFASRTIALTLRDVLLRRENRRFAEMKEFLLYERRKGRQASRLAVAVVRLTRAAEKSAVDRWRDCLDWPTTAAVRQNAVAKYVVRRSASNLFQAWKAFAHSEILTRRGHSHALSQLFSLYLSRIRATLQCRVAMWKGRVSATQHRNRMAQSLVYRGSVGKLRDSLRVWRGSVHRSHTEQAKEDVSTILSSTLLMQAVLSGWKTVAARSRGREMLVRVQQRSGERLRQTVALHALKRYLEKKREQHASIGRVLRRTTEKGVKSAFSVWKREIQDFKHTEAMARVLTRQHYKRYATILEKLFFAWKTLLLGNKVTHLQSRLHEEIPRRQALEADLHLSIEKGRRDSVLSVLRLAGKRLAAQVKPYVRHWRQVCVCMQKTQPTLRRFMLTWYWRKQESAFREWKALVLNTDLASLYEKNQGLAGRNATLAEHIGNLEQVLAHREEERVGFTNRSLASAMRFCAKFQLRDALRKWGEIALVSIAKSHSSERMVRQMAKILYNWTFVVLKRNATDKKQSDVRHTRLRVLYAKTWRNTLFVTFEAWKEFRTQSKSQQALMKRVIARMQNHQKATAMELWHSAVAAINHFESVQTHQKMLSLNSDLSDQVKGLTGQLQGETAHSQLLTRKIHEKAQKRLVNMAVRMLTNSMYRGFASWKSVAVLKRKQSQKTQTLTKVFHKQELRTAIRLWQFFASKTRKLLLQEQVAISQRDHKETRRVLKSTQDELSAVIEARDQALSQKDSQIGVLETRFSAVLDRIVRDQSTEYSLGKAGYVFKFWSNRYRVMKSALQKLLDVSYRAVLKNSLCDIREFTKDRNEYTAFTVAVSRWMESFTSRQLRTGFALWRSKTKASITGELQDLYTRKTAHANTLQTTLLSQKEKAAMFAFEANLRVQKTRAVRGWKAEADTLRKHKRANIAFIETVRIGRMQLGLDRLRDYKEAGLEARRKVVGALVRKEAFYKRRIFRELHSNAIAVRRLNAIFSLLERRFAREAGITGLAAIRKEAEIENLQADHLFARRDASLHRMLTAVCYGRLSRGFRTWHHNSHAIDRSRCTLRKAVLHSLQRKYSSALSLWKEHQSFLRLSAYFVSESPLATENQMLNHRIEIYSKLIEDEGMEQKHVEKYIMERESLAEALKWKGVSRLRYAAGMTQKASEDQTSVLPRALLTWKVWVSKRKKVKRLASRMRAYRSNPCMGAFHTWKHGLPLVRNTLAAFTRPDLISLIAKMDRDIKTMEVMVEDHNKRLSYLHIYSSLLEQHTRRGRNQSLVVLSKQVRSPLHQAVRRWSDAVNRQKAEEMRQQITALDDSYHVLALKYEQLEQEYTIIFDENSELRQATLDGLDLADAIETLSKERERLSVDLAERAATIKQLLEENNELATRMRAAQKEAETLRILTAPERESRYV